VKRCLRICDDKSFKNIEMTKVLFKHLFKHGTQGYVLKMLKLRILRWKGLFRKHSDRLLINKDTVKDDDSEVNEWLTNVKIWRQFWAHNLLNRKTLGC
jgi:hypothetical protein